MTSGFCRVSRNPMHVGSALTGWVISTGRLVSIVSLAGFVWSLNRSQIEPKQRACAARFGPISHVRCPYAAVECKDDPHAISAGSNGYLVKFSKPVSVTNT
jgi:hypothetical protein